MAQPDQSYSPVGVTLTREQWEAVVDCLVALGDWEADGLAERILGVLRGEREDGTLSPAQHLRHQVKELAFHLPDGDPGGARLGLLLMEITRELGRLDTRIELIADEALGAVRYTIREGVSDDLICRRCGRSGSARGVLPEQAGTSTVADHHARL